jgi:hypothetical protein
MVFVRSIKSKKVEDLCLTFIYWFSSTLLFFMQIQVSDILFSFLLNNFYKYFLQGRFTGDNFLQFSSDKVYFSSIVFVCVCVCVCDCTGGWTQCLMLACRGSTTWVTLAALFVLVIFEIGSHIYAWVSLDCNPPVCALPCSWDDRHVPLRPTIGWDGISGAFAGLKLWSSQSLPPG